MAQEYMTPDEYFAELERNGKPMTKHKKIEPFVLAPKKEKRGKSPWSNAKKTRVGENDFDSQMEARVYCRLRDTLPTGAVLFRQVRVPLYVLAPRKSGQPFYIKIDFLIRHADGRLEWVEAKSQGRVSRDWPARAAAFTSSYGPLIEVDR